MASPSPGVTVRVSGSTRQPGGAAAPHQAPAGRRAPPGRVVLASEAQLQGWLNAPPPAPRRATATSARAGALSGELPGTDPGALPGTLPGALSAGDAGPLARTSPNAWFASSATMWTACARP